ncbi:MAG: MFS transporter [Actinomycetota bacterium]|nr:MFS transporter [Actinomycetota bacterium]
MAENPKAPSARMDSPGALRRWLMMPPVALGVAMIIVDATIVNVALPTMIRQLGLGPADAEWVNSIYALVFAALLITLGRMGDRFGRRLLFVSGAVIFAAASLLSASADSSSMLLLGRFVQGVGGAMILPATLSLLNTNFQGRERGIAFAIWGSTIAGVAALGPLLGGWLTSSYSWRWAFLINLPLAALILVGSYLWVPESRDPFIEKHEDLIGNLLLIVSLAGLVFGLIEGQRYGWWTQVSSFAAFGASWPAAWPSPIPLSFVLAALAAAAFFPYELRRGRRDLPRVLDFALFSIRSFGFGNLASLIVALGEFGILFALPLYLQGARGYSALATGVVLVPLAIATFSVGALNSALTKRIGARGVVRLGLALETVGIASLTLTVTASSPVAWLEPSLVVYGFGIGLATAQLTGVVLEEVPVDKSGLGSGIQSTARQLGSALGIAILGTILYTRLGGGLSSRLANLGVLPESLRRTLVETVRQSGGAAIPQLANQPGGEAVHQAAVAAMTSATRASALVAAIFVLAGLASTLLLPREVDIKYERAEPPAEVPRNESPFEGFLTQRVSEVEDGKGHPGPGSELVPGLQEGKAVPRGPKGPVSLHRRRAGRGGTP